MGFVGVRPRPGPSAMDTRTTHGRWLGTECTWSRYQSHLTQENRSPDTRAHARNKTHTHGGPLDVTSGWGQYTQRAEGERLRDWDNGVMCVYNVLACGKILRKIRQKCSLEEQTIN